MIYCDQRSYSPGYSPSPSPRYSPSPSPSPRPSSPRYSPSPRPSPPRYCPSSSPSPRYSPSPSPYSSPRHSERPYHQRYSPSRDPSFEPESDNDNSGRYGYSEKRRRYSSIDPPGSPPCKRCRTSPKEGDRISKLQDSILLCILSFLPTQEAVKTCVLSKRWADLWTAVPCLNFSNRGFENRNHPVDDFFSFVNETLVLHRPSRMEKFSLDLNYEPCYAYASSVNRWLRLVNIANVEELSLSLEVNRWEDGDAINHYTLPQHLYSNSSLRKLNLSWCTITPNKKISWHSLKSLSIGYIELSRKLLQNIFGGCQLLEYLELYKFYGIDCLEFANERLRKLVIRDYWDFKRQGCESVLEIKAPFLQSLDILGDMHRMTFRVVQSNYLELGKSCLDFEQAVFIEDRDNNYEHHQNMLKRLLLDLRHVNHITMGSWCIQVLSILELKCTLYPRSFHKCIVLDMHMKKWDLPGVANLLQRSPFLETLVINMTSPFVPEFPFDVSDPDPNSDGENYWTSQERTFKFLRTHLKTVKITGFVARNSNELVIPFIQFLLKHGRVLEKLTINAQRVDGNRLWKGCTPQELFEVSQKLLTFPRASNCAVVTFSE